MKLSEVIKKLQKIQKEYGDLSVRATTSYYDTPFGDTVLKFTIKHYISYEK